MAKIPRAVSDYMSTIGATGGQSKSALKLSKLSDAREKLRIKRLQSAELKRVENNRIEDENKA